MDPVKKREMDKNASCLYLFTNEYPYGTGETFIENELIALASKFQSIYLFPLTKNGVPRPLPAESIQVVSLFEDNTMNKREVLLKNHLLICKILFFELWKVKSVTAFFKSFRLLNSILLINIHRAEVLQQFIQSLSSKKNAYYSFWTDDWAIVLSILTKKKYIDGFVSRVHGYDLYEERWPNNIIPFRNFQLKNVSKIITASKDGLKYLRTHYSQYTHKFFLKHLNVSDNGSNPFIEDSEFTIVSCANISDLKRVHLIPPLLKQLTFSTRWIHFGTGEGLDALKSEIKSLPNNITVELRGHVKNEELIRFYQQQKVNLFIHLSETEGGVPLVLQEAASFGIPLLATDTGGIPEIVTKETGILIPINFNNEDVVKHIIAFASPSFNALAFRIGVKAYWNEYFNAQFNKDKIYDLLIN